MKSKQNILSTVYRYYCNVANACILHWRCSLHEIVWKKAEFRILVV